jgi:DNA-binding NarL/FixJ family response regulator
MDTGDAGMIRVFLAEDQEIVRRGMALIVETAEDMEVVGGASDGLTAVEHVARLRPDVVVMDLEMPGMSGIDATRQIADANLGVAVLIYTIHESGDLLYRSREAERGGTFSRRLESTICWRLSGLYTQAQF